MSKTRPDLHYESGRSLLSQGLHEKAAEQFRLAIETEREVGCLRPRMRYLSFYGLARALTAGRPTLEDLRLCERAAAEESFDATLQLNLGKVCLLAGKTTKALAAFERGLRIDPGDRRLRAMLRRADRRSKPLISGLSRNHAINRSLGRLRVSLTRSRQAGNSR